MPITYDRKAVCDAVRAPVFDGHLDAAREAGIDRILGEWEAAYPSGDTRFVAYMLATAAWETAHTMHPIKERGGAAYFTRMYDIAGARPQVARRLGNTQPGDGARFCGRGLPQTTGRTNYAWASSIVGKDCVADPDLLLDPRWACKVMFAAMLAGKYTGKKLSDYFTVHGADWRGARRIVNGTDHATEIAAYGQHFLAGLKAGLREAPAPIAVTPIVIATTTLAAPVTARPVPAPVMPAPARVPAPPPAGFLARITSFLGY